MHELMLNIDNREILIEILHHSIDYLIGSSGKSGSTLSKTSHKYGFENDQDFDTLLRGIGNAYKLFVLERLSEEDLLMQFAHMMTQELQQSVIDVIGARKNEIVLFLRREYNGRSNKLLESFDWNLKLVIGNSSLASYRNQIATLLLNCMDSSGTRSQVNFEMNRTQLDKLIKALEEVSPSV